MAWAATQDSERSSDRIANIGFAMCSAGEELLEKGGRTFP